MEKRLHWKEIMKDTLINGPNYWSNGHFALLNDKVEIPKAVKRLDIGYKRDKDQTFNSLLRDGERVTSDRQQWEEKGDFTFTGNGGAHLKDYMEMLEKLIPGFTLDVQKKIPLWSNDFIPSIIKKDGDIVGMIMPVQTNT